jgi:hypothetical protein
MAPIKSLSFLKINSHAKMAPDTGVFARIRSFAHNILRINQTDSIA